LGPGRTSAKVKEEGALVIPDCASCKSSGRPLTVRFTAKARNHWAQIVLAGRLSSSWVEQGIVSAFPTGAKPLANIDAPLLAGCVAKTHFSASQDTNRVAWLGEVGLRKAGLTMVRRMVPALVHRAGCDSANCRRRIALNPRKALLCLQSWLLRKRSRGASPSPKQHYVFFVRGSRGSSPNADRAVRYEKVLPTGHPCT